MRSLDKINKIILHCSDSDLPEHDNINVIKEWHLKRGFVDVGYHYFIDKKGHIFEGRKLNIEGAHCKGQNSDSVGICLSGRHDFRTAQYLTLELLIYSLFDMFGEINIFGHCDFNENKTCPNFDYKTFMDRLNYE